MNGEKNEDYRMQVTKPDIQAIFNEAIALASDEDRARYLDEACGGDLPLRTRAEALLNAHSEAGGFFGGKSSADVMTQAQAFTEVSGAVIGPYKLLQEIGEGGMGTVFMAEQTEPVQRKVALKLVKPGMDSRQVVARFEAERQALAMMDHPHIAKVLDAGATDAGRPFFVMELVKGIPITKFCDEHHLTPRERLELFIPVCQAVQHAHQKGIIHRDLKPSNVLIALYDGRPVPKVIDFGVAKATGQKLTERTMFTQLGQIVGTLEYMSPEQAEVNQLDIDTRSDIYSLGVLLYELLTGTTPFEKKRLREAAFDELLRIIREEEPPKPSTRLSATDELPSIAANRKTEPRKLSGLVRGELDWIVMRALEKDRDRRYATANGFAADVQRYLADEPVEACAPSVGYRLRKFVRRNRAAVLTAMAILFVLVAGIAGTTFGLIRAEIRRAEADDARANEAAQRSIADAQRKKAEQAEADTLADYRASSDEAIEQLIGSKPSLGTQEKAYLEKTLKRWQAFAARQGGDELSRYIRAEGHYRVAYLWAKLGQREKSRTEFVTARDLRKKLTDDFPGKSQYRHELAFTQLNLGLQLEGLGLRDQALTEYESARDILQKLTAAFPKARSYQRDLASSHSRLGALLDGLGQFDAARTHYETARDLQQELADAFPAVPTYGQGLVRVHADLGYHLCKVRRYGAARTEFEIARDLQQKLVDASPEVIEYQDSLAAVQMNLGLLLNDMGQRNAARTEYESARDRIKKLAAAFPAVPRYQTMLAAVHANLANLLISLGQRDAAGVEHEAALDLDKKLAVAFPSEPEYQIGLGGGYCNYGNLIAGEGRLADSLQWYDLAIRTLTPVYEQDRRAVTAREFLRNSHLGRASAYGRLKKHAEAAKDWDKIFELDPNNVELYSGRGRDLIDQKLLDEAVTAFRTALEVDPKHVNAYLGLGRALFDQNKLDEAVAVYLKAVEVAPKRSTPLVGLGATLRGQKKFAEALAVFRKATVLDPNDANAQSYLGLALSEQRRWVEARAVLERAVNIKPDFAWPRANLAWILANSPDPGIHDLPRALEHAQKATELEPNNRLRWNHLGAIQYRAGMYQQVLETLHKAEQMEQAPDEYHRVYLVLANWRLDKKHEALKYWVQFVPWMDRAAPALAQDEPLHYEELRNLRAEAEGLLGEFRDLETACREVLRAEPKAAIAQYALANSFAGSRQWAKSAAAYIIALDLEEPVTLPTWFDAACTILHAGNTDGYRKLCETMAQRYGQSQKPHEIAFLAHVCVLAPNGLVESGRIVQLAEQRIALTAGIQGHKLWSTHILGLALYRAGEYEKAVATLEAGQKEPDLTSEVKMSNWLTLAMTRHRLGQGPEAAAALQSARKILTTEKRELDRQNLIVQILFREAESLLGKQ